MKHTYELRKLENDDSVNAVLILNEEPGVAKRKATDYTNKHPGLYSLRKVEIVKTYFTEKE